MKKHIIFLTYSVWFVSLIFFVTATYASSVVPPPIQQTREELQAQRCTTLTQNIDRRISRFNNNKERHMNQYNTAKQRLSQLTEKLQKQGYDVPQLQADGQTWDIKIQKFATDFTVLINILTATKNTECGQSKGTFRTLMSQARQQVKIVHQDSVDARTYYQTVIKADIQAIRDQKPTVNNTQ